MGKKTPSGEIIAAIRYISEQQQRHNYLALEHLSGHVKSLTDSEVSAKAKVKREKQIVNHILQNSYSYRLTSETDDFYNDSLYAQPRKIAAEVALKHWVEWPGFFEKLTLADFILDHIGAPAPEDEPAPDERDILIPLIVDTVRAEKSPENRVQAALFLGTSDCAAALINEMAQIFIESIALLPSKARMQYIREAMAGDHRGFINEDALRASGLTPPIHHRPSPK